jgi:Na+/H+-dicarboxylate symporter
MRITRIPLHWLILIGMAAGIIFGILAVIFGWHEFTLNWIKPWGTVFISLLKMIAIPLIIVSLINGISGLNDVSKLSRIGLKTISLYLITTVIAVSIGLIVVNITQPGKFLSQEKSAEFREKYASHMTQTVNEESGPLQFVVDLVVASVIVSLVVVAVVVVSKTFANTFVLAMILSIVVAFYLLDDVDHVIVYVVASDATEFAFTSVIVAYDDDALLVPCFYCCSCY